MNKLTPILNDTPPFSTSGGVSIDPKKPNSVSQDSWDTYMKVYNHAKKLGDPYPELFATQAALESGWFKKESGKNNYFGIKARKNEQGTIVNTQEDTANGKIKIKAKFKDYDSIDKAIEDRYNRFTKIYSDATTLNEAIDKLHKSSYATDKKYGETLTSMLKTQKVSLDKAPSTQTISTESNDSLFKNNDIEKMNQNMNRAKDAIPTRNNLNFEKDLDFNIKTNKNFTPSTETTSLDIKPINESKLSLDEDAISKMNANMDRLKSINPAAMGGLLNNNYALGGDLDFSIQSNDALNSFNTGGTHEQNPLGGIPQGIGTNGNINTVEEDETSFNIKGKKFIFSNRIKI